jgi:hypothetical protein
MLCGLRMGFFGEDKLDPETNTDMIEVRTLVRS